MMTEEEVPGTIKVIHDKPRQDLYMPSRVDGRAPQQVLTGARETHAIDLRSGQLHIYADDWRSRGADLTSLGANWIGWTVFTRKGWTRPIVSSQ